eukprot:g4620.t1
MTSATTGGDTSGPGDQRRWSTAPVPCVVSSSQQSSASGKTPSFSSESPCGSVIAFPGCVNNPSKAVELLGGSARIHSAIAEPSVNGTANLYCNLADKNRFVAPIGPATKKPTNSVLLARNKKTNQLRFVAHCRYRFDFDTLADFQYAAPASLKHGAAVVSGESLEAELGKIGCATQSTAPSSASSSSRSASGNKADAATTTFEPLYLPPPVFTKTTTPLDYNFEENPHTTTAPGTHPDGTVTRSWIPLQLLKCDAAWDRIPQKAPEGATVENYLQRVEVTGAVKERELLERLQVLFEKRPIWIRSALLAEVEDEELHVTWWLQRALQAVSYIWENGPFRGSHCRLGFDPRKAPENGRYQVIDFRDELLKGPQARSGGGGVTSSTAAGDSPTGTGSSLGVGNKATTTTAASATIQMMQNHVHFRVPPQNRSQLYQLCDLEDETIQNIVGERLKEREGSTLDVNDHFGWVGESVLKKIRDRMQVKSALMRESGSKKRLLYLT